eukprot:2289339-Rhodomonas_salina.4
MCYLLSTIVRGPRHVSLSHALSHLSLPLPLPRSSLLLLSSRSPLLAARRRRERARRVLVPAYATSVLGSA